MVSDPRKVARSTPYTVHGGVAAEDIAPDSTVLQIICPELLPHTAFGTVAAGIATGNVTLKNRDGGAISSPVNTANHIVATWEGATNTRYPPMIRKGEPVEVYKVGDQDKFYWKSTGRGRSFRTTDRAVMEVGATDPTKPGVDKDDTNTYSGYLDSHNKKVGFKTSTVNGEACAFTMEADLAAGTFYISDNGSDPGNRIFLDTGSKSGVPVFQVNLASGAALKFEGDNGFIKIPKKFEISAGERIVMNSPIIAFNLTTVGTFIINAANIAINASKDIMMSASNTVGISAVSTKIAGVLIAATVRAVTVVKGAFGTPYAPVSVARPEETDPVIPINTADTDVSGSGDRTACAAEQFEASMHSITSAFTEINAKIGVPSVGSSLTDLGNQSYMHSVKGDS